MQDEAQRNYIDLINKLAGAESPAAGPSDSSRYQGLEICKQGKAFRLTFNRPSKKNAITWQVQ